MLNLYNVMKGPDKLWSLLFFVHSFTQVEKSVKYLKAIHVTQGDIFLSMAFN